MSELDLLRALGRRLPRAPRMLGVANHVLRRTYTRRARSRVIRDVGGVHMELDPHELVDGLLLFAPHLYERRERDFLIEGLQPGDTFVDLGAHIGLYSLLAAHRGARVVAVEPDPDSRGRLVRNARLNGLELTVDPRAVDARAGVARLGIGRPGNRGGSTLLRHDRPTVEVQAARLADILGPLNALSALKVDIEGLEADALDSLFDAGLFPERIVVEHHVGWTRDPTDRLRREGSRLRAGSSANVLASRT